MDVGACLDVYAVAFVCAITDVLKVYNVHCTYNTMCSAIVKCFNANINIYRDQQVGYELLHYFHYNFLHIRSTNATTQ